MSFFAFSLVVVLIVAAVILLANRKTRPFMLGALGVGALLMLGWFVSARQAVRHEHQQAVWMQQEAARRHLAEQRNSHPIAPLPEATAVIPLDEGAPPEPANEASRPIPSNRPAWVDQPDGIEDGAYRMVVVSDPWATKRECDEALNEQLLGATQSYLAARLGERTPEELPVDLAYIRHRVCKDEYTEILDTSVGPMRRVHMLLEFDEPVARDLMRRAHAALVRQRLFQAGGAAAAVLAALGVAFGYLSLTKAKGA